MATKIIARDQERVRAFRALFQLTQEELARITGISLRTWERVEQGSVDRERASRGVYLALETIEEIMGHLDKVPYGTLRIWLTRPRAGGRGSLLDLVRKPGGLAQFVQYLRSRGDGVS